MCASLWLERKSHAELNFAAWSRCFSDGAKLRRVYEAIRETETSIDDIATKAELPSGTVSSTLLRLELKKLVKQLPGKYFVKLG